MKGNHPGIPPSQRTSARPEIDPGRIAEAVHRAVCEFSKSDGYGRCAMYTEAGFGLLIRLGVIGKPPRIYPQAGALLLNPDPDQPDRWTTMETEGDALSRGEFHAWLAGEDGTLIDFASRHYRRFIEEFITISSVLGQDDRHALFLLDTENDRVPWNRPDPLAYLWSTRAEIPPWVRFHADERTCRAYWDRFTSNPAMSRDLRVLAAEHYERLGAAG